MDIIIDQIEQRSWIEIDLDQIERNYFIYKNLLHPNTQIMAVIKADAYGHGDYHIAKWLTKNGCSNFAVSNIDEAVGLRKAGINGNILILGYTSPKYARTIYNLNLSQTIISEEYAKLLCDTGYNLRCQFAIDTGMNRIGLNGDNPDICSNIIRYYKKKIQVEGIFTHLCVADTDTKECNNFTLEQIAKFKTIVNSISDLKLPFIHCYNSAGGMYYQKNTEDINIGNIVRLGIVLYGLKPDYNNQLPNGIAPAMTWKSVVSMVKDVYPGETIGYGRSYKANVKKRIATVTTGYADGLNRLLSNHGFMIIDGEKAPIVGRICMDQTLIDVTDIPNVGMGSKVTIIGCSGNLSYTADDMAADLDTIGYEVICNISKRVQRYYKTHGLIYVL